MFWFFFIFSSPEPKLIGELIVYQSLRRLSVVVRPSTFSNIFSSETTGQIKLKFDKETP